MQPADKNRHVYENREQVHESLGLYNSPRRASFDDGAFDSSRMESINEARQGKQSNGDDDKLYQNVQPGSNSHQSRASPTKKTHLSPFSVPVPEGYYTVTPPPLVRRHHSSNASPSSSPEESGLREDMSLMDAHLNQISWTDHDQELSMDIVGDNLIVNKSSRQRSKALSPPREAGETSSVYQNVEFMNTPGGDHVSKRYIHT